MARKGRVDRGLVRRLDRAGKPVWVVRFYHEGQERQFGNFKTKTEARDFYEKAKQEQKAKRFFPERYHRGGYELVQETLDRYEATLTGKKPETVAGEKYYATWWKERLKGKRLNAITPAVLEEAMRDLSARGLAPQTIVHYMKFLRHVLYIALRDGKLEHHPFAKIKLPKVRPGKTRFLSLEEEDKLVKALGPVHGPWARLAILTGMRKSEQFGLRWSDVDLEQALITLPHTKAGGVQYVHLNAEAIAILRGMESWQRSVWVFPSENPQSHLEVHNFYGRIFLPAVKKACLEGVTWHTLRHTFASRLAMNGQGASTIAALLRHSGTDLVARYAHLSPSHLNEAVEGVAGFGKGQAQSPSPGGPVGGPISDETRTQTRTDENHGDEGGEGEAVQVVEEMREDAGRGERI